MEITFDLSPSYTARTKEDRNFIGHDPFSKILPTVLTPRASALHVVGRVMNTPEVPDSYLGPGDRLF
jgi:hypothetical protein